MEIREHVERLKTEAGGTYKLAQAIGVSYQTIYNLLKGGWPSKEVAERLGLALNPAAIPETKLKPVEKAIMDSLPRKDHDKKNCRVYGCLMCKQEV